MIDIVFNKKEFEYDAYTLIKAFYPQEEVSILYEGEEKTESSQKTEEAFLVVKITYNKEDTRLAILKNKETVFEETIFSASDDERKERKNKLKQALYRGLSKETKKVLPWGDLTGIRPTKIAMGLIESGMSNVETAEFMRNTYYTSNEKTALAITIANRERALLADIDYKNGYSLYVGIPFCTTRCAYCSFSSGEIGDGHLVEPYLKALFREIEACAEMAREMGLHVRVGYIGGGTPSSLTTSQLESLLNHIEKHFGTMEEFTVEAGRPDTLDEQKLRMIHHHPVTRISINPQTMNDETLVRIGRAHTAQQTIQAYRLARHIGFDDINMDVIAALPGENYAMFAHTLEEIHKLQPESLTVHTLAIKRSSRLHEEKYAQREQDVARMVALGRQTAHEMGMRAYYLYRQKYMAENLENVGYALPGCFCRYNIDNMEETTSVLALGAGGISKCVMKEEEKILRAPNIANIEQYIERVDEMVERKYNVFSKKQID